MVAEEGLTRRHFLSAWILGSVFTGLIIGLTTALFRTPWLMPVFVLLGALALTTLFVRAWRLSPQKGRVPAKITHGTAILLLLLSGVMLTVFGVVLVIGAATAHPVCVCLNASSWSMWATLVIGGAILTGLLAPVLCGMVVALRRLMQHDDPRSPVTS
jgi:threonine/homoserine/homoserine lactone efflux protein